MLLGRKGLSVDILLSDNRLLDESLPKHHALIRPLQAVLHNHPAGANTERSDHPPLVIEIRHNHSEPIIFDPEQVLHWDFDIVKLDVRRTSSS